MSKKNIEWIDIAKGILMLIVIWGHSNIYFDSFGKFLTAPYMAAFFFLSGYLINPEKIGGAFETYFVQKAKRLLLPVAIYGVILCIIAQIINNDGYNIFERLVGLLYSRYMLYPYFGDDNIYFLQSYNSVLWFLTAMFSASVLVYVYFRTKYKKIIVSLYLAASLVLACLPILLPWSIDSAPLFAIFMICGYYYKNNEKYVENLSKNKRLALWVVLFLVYMAMVYVNGAINLSIRSYGSFGVYSFIPAVPICIIGCYLLCRVTLQMEKHAKFFKCFSFIGKYSITYMSVHLLFLDVITKFVGDILPQKFFVSICEFLNIGTRYSRYMIRLISGVSGILLSLAICYLLVRLFVFLSKRKGMQIFKYL